jgi:hypothetical protein
MRRILAITLLIAFGSPLALLALASPTTSNAQRNLPACCRRNGAHHCNGGMSTDDTNPALQSPPCSNYPSPGTPVSLNTAALAAPTTFAIEIPIAFALRTATRPRAHSSILSSNLQRGPPSHLA